MVVIFLGLFIIAAVIYAATHGLLAVALIIAVLGIPGCIIMTVMRAHSKKRFTTRDEIKNWDHAYGPPDND